MNRRLIHIPVHDGLIERGEAAKFLGVSKSTIISYEKKQFYVPFAGGQWTPLLEKKRFGKYVFYPFSQIQEMKKLRGYINS